MDRKSTTTGPATDPIQQSNPQTTRAENVASTMPPAPSESVFQISAQEPVNSEQPQVREDRIADADSAMLVPAAPMVPTQEQVNVEPSQVEADGITGRVSIVPALVIPIFQVPTGETEHSESQSTDSNERVNNQTESRSLPEAQVSG